MSELTVSEVASALGVSPQRVRQLIAAGSVPARRVSSGWLVPAAAVEQRRDVRPGRPVSATTSWAAVHLLSGEDSLLDRRVRHHLRALLAPAEDNDPQTSVRRILARRSVARRLWAHPGVLDRVLADACVSPGGVPAVGAQGGDPLTGGPIDLYARAADAARLCDRFALRDDPDGNVVLHVVPDDVPGELAPIPGEPVPLAAAAADLLDSGDARSAARGLELLDAARQHIAAEIKGERR